MNGPGRVALALTMLVALAMGLGALAVSARSIPVLLVAVAACALPWCIARPAWRVYLLALVTPLTLALPRSEALALLRPHELLLGGMVLLTLLAAVFGPRSRGPRPDAPRRTPLDTAFAVYCLARIVVPGIALLFRPIRPTMQDYLFLVAPIEEYCLYLVVRSSIRRPAEINAAAVAMLATSLVVAALGIAQALNVAGISELLAQLYPSIQTRRAVNVSRVTSTMGGWNDLSAYLAASAVLAVGLLWNRGGHWHRLTLFVLVLAHLFTIALAGSFAPTVGLVVGIGTLMALNGSRGKGFRAIAAGTLLVAVVALVVSQSNELMTWVGARIARQWATDGAWVPQTFAARLELWPWVWQVGTRDLFALLLGSGPTPEYVISLLGPSWELIRFFLFAQRVYGGATEESQYLLLLLRFGLVGLLGHLLLIGVALRMLMAGRASPVEAIRRYSQTGVALLVMFSIMGVTNAYFTYSGAATTLWMVIGLSAARLGAPPEAPATARRPADRPEARRPIANKEGL